MFLVIVFYCNFIFIVIVFFIVILFFYCNLFFYNCVFIVIVFFIIFVFYCNCVSLLDFFHMILLCNCVFVIVFFLYNRNVLWGPTHSSFPPLTLGLLFIRDHVNSSGMTSTHSLAHDLNMTVLGGPTYMLTR